MLPIANLIAVSMQTDRNSSHFHDELNGSRDNNYKTLANENWSDSAIFEVDVVRKLC